MLILRNGFRRNSEILRELINTRAYIILNSFCVRYTAPVRGCKSDYVSDWMSDAFLHQLTWQSRISAQFFFCQLYYSDLQGNVEHPHSILSPFFFTKIKKEM